MEIQFIDEEISSFGGVAILKKMMDKLSFEKVLSSLPLPPQKSPRGYPPIQLLIQFITSLWCGASRYAHLDISRFDNTIQKLFGWAKMPEHKAFKRYFSKFTLPISQAVFGGLYRWFFAGQTHLKFFK